MEPSHLYYKKLFGGRTRPEDQNRLVRASGFVFIPLTLFFSTLFTNRAEIPGSSLLDQEKKEEQAHIYPVLVEQADAPPVEKEQMRTLSDVSAAGKGGITEKEGFHTLTPYDTLEPGNPTRAATGGSSGSPGGQESSPSPRQDGSYMEQAEPEDERKERERDEDEAEPDGILWVPERKVARKKTENQNQVQEPMQGSQAARKGNKSRESQESVPEQDFKIPANYRFRKDFIFRYDQSSRLSVARQELVGFRYFQSMLRQIKDSFAPPGYNYAYRDFAGTVISQPIKPQTVKVQFLLDDDGLVRDVRIISSMGQPAVDQACVNALRDQNFGVPPPEIFEAGHIFGIDFVFPAAFN